jgi:threonine aldolase
VIFKLTGEKTAAELVAGLKARGVLMSAVGPKALRLVTHNDVSRAGCVRAAEVLTEEVGAAKVA